MDKNKEYLAHKVAEVVELLENLGFLVNWEKSQLSPLQEITYLGLVVDSKIMKLRLPKKKISQLIKYCDQIVGRGILVTSGVIPPYQLSGAPGGGLCNQCLHEGAS